MPKKKSDRLQLNCQATMYSIKSANILGYRWNRSIACAFLCGFIAFSQKWLRIHSRTFRGSQIFRNFDKTDCKLIRELKRIEKKDVSRFPLDWLWMISRINFQDSSKLLQCDHMAKAGTFFRVLSVSSFHLHLLWARFDLVFNTYIFIGFNKENSSTYITYTHAYKFTSSHTHRSQRTCPWFNDVSAKTIT